ncbi:prolyl 4-hydroxylase 1 [Olea europaea subsp. europaea]|uniref:Prolyl 4-hydroxylase 1 n=2 Tax=Olea europaea subsp. europaea TaxID=158383 RepID=A0A8S0Q096_OLEEU|nr:prolyl 4-hydroxylase 1 [Olea europaea subsp. europaea]
MKSPILFPMASPATRFVFALLTFVTMGMIIGALLQLAYIRRLEDSYGTESSLRRLRETRNGGGVQLTRGISHWEDEEALILRLGYVKPEIISWSPRIIVFHNFLSTEECDYLRELAKPRLQVSTVVDTRTGKGIKSDVRTSSGMFLSHEERKKPLIQAIEKRISVYSQVPIENGELIQVLRYEKNQFYRPHHDYFSDTFNLKRGGQRVATMLMYLSDNVEGGETFFPQAGSGECSCGGKMVEGLCVKPNKGDAVLFWSMGLDGKSDPSSLHGGCKVLSGEKWSATKWMRQKTAT